MYLQLYLSVVLLVSVLAPLSHGYCCNPDQSEARAVGITELVQSETQTIAENIVSVSYDYTNKRIAMSYNTSISGKMSEAKLIIKQLKAYSIDLIKQTCVVEPVALMNRSCIPDEATEMGTRDMGIGTASFLDTSYRFPNTYKGMTYLSVTKDKCTYVTEVSYGTVNNIYAMSAFEFFNTTLGIKDPSVFDIPSYCQQATLNVDSLIKGGYTGELRNIYNPLSLF